MLIKIIKATETIKLLDKEILINLLTTCEIEIITNIETVS